MSATMQPTTAGVQRLIVDTDCGVDDAQALMLAFAHPTARVEVITAVSGNCGVDQVVKNVARVSRHCAGLPNQRAPPAIYGGAANRMLGLGKDPHTAEYWHGRDGLGDAPDPPGGGATAAAADEPPIGDTTSDGAVPDASVRPSKRQRADPDAADVQNILADPNEHAAAALVRITREQPGAFTLVALGPLTNIAIALLLDPCMGERIKKFVFMGTARDGVGNATYTAEFNTYADPESLAVVLAHIKAPCVCVDWLATQDNALPMDWFEDAISGPTDRARFMKRVSAGLIAASKSSRWASRGFLIPDPLAMAVALQPEAALESEEATITVELAGEFTRGMVVKVQRSEEDAAAGVADRAGHKVQFVTKIDMAIVMAQFKASVQ